MLPLLSTAAMYLSGRNKTPKSNFVAQQSTAPAQSSIIGRSNANMSNAPIGNSAATTAKPAPSPAKSQYIQQVASTPSTPAVDPNVNPNRAMQESAFKNAPAGTPDAATLSSSDPQASYRSAFNEYIASLKPSAEETQANDYLKSLTLQSKKDYEKALESGETLGFAAGEAARVNRNNSFGIEAAANAVDSFSGARTATNAAQKARLDFEKSLMPSADPYTLGEGQTRYDAKGNVIARGQAGSFELSEGQDRYELNPETGKYEKVASKGKTYAPSSGGGGYGGGTTPGNGSGQLSALAQAVQNGTIALDKIPIAQRAGIAAELATFGAPSSRQQALTSNLSAVNALLDNPNRTKITGFIQGKLGLGNLDPRAQLAVNQYNQLKGILSLESREKLKGSGAISDFEFKVLSDAATALGRNLSDSEFESQLKKVRDVFEGKYAGTTAGGNAGAASYQLPDGTVVYRQPDGTYSAD